MREAERELRVLDRAGEDVRDAVGVAQDLHRRGDARHGDLALYLRQRPAQVQIARRPARQREDHDQDHKANQEPHRPQDTGPA